MWWLPHDPATRLPGHLQIGDDHRCTLSLLAKFAELPARDYTVILGQTFDGTAVSLHRMSHIGGSLGPRSGQNHSTFQGTHTYLGAWFDTAEAVRFTHFGATIYGLVDWLRASDFIRQRWAEDEKSVTLSNDNDADSDCNAEIRGVTVRVTSASPQFSYMRNRQIGFTQTAAVRMSTREPTPIAVFLERLHDFQSFLWLLGQRPATIEALGGECEPAVSGVEERDGRRSLVEVFIAGLTTSHKQPSERSQALLLGDAIAPIFAEVFPKWVALRDEMPTVQQLFFLPEYGNALYTESRFLGLVQACEAYARTRLDTKYMPQSEWINGPYQKLIASIPETLPADLSSSIRARLQYAYLHSFRRMIASLVDETPAVRDKLILYPPAFANDVATLRNYIVHVAAELRGEAAKAPPVADIINYLEILLNARFLVDIGLGSESVLDALMSAVHGKGTSGPRHYSSPFRKHYVRISSG